MPRVLSCPLPTESTWVLRTIFFRFLMRPVIEPFQYSSKRRARLFLSCLLGSELPDSCGGIASYFLSCLLGSELGPPLSLAV